MKICMHVYSPEPAENNLHVPHAASSCGAASLGLSAPVVLSLALGRVATLPAGGLLQVIRLGSTAAAQSVRLITTLTER